MWRSCECSCITCMPTVSEKYTKKYPLKTDNLNLLLSP